RADRPAIGDRPRERDRPDEPRPRLRDKGERRYHAGMAAGPGRYQDQAIGALLDRLVGEFLVDHVVEDNAAPPMRGLIELLARAERSDDHRHLMLLAKREIVLEPVVRSV